MDYTIAYRPEDKAHALYRKGSLVATWSHDPNINNRAYVDKQVKHRGGSDAEVEEVTIEGTFPETLTPEVPKTKGIKKVKESPAIAPPVVSEDD